MNAHRLNGYAIIGAWVLFMVNAGFLFWYLMFGYQDWFHSDSAAKVLLAKEIVTTGEYFPQDWNYVNNDLFVLFGHTFIIPFLPFMKAGYKVHALSGLISSVMILLGVWLLTGMAKISPARRYVILALSATGISGFMAENLYGQVSYGTTVYFACFTIYLGWRLLHPENFGRRHLCAAALLVLTILAYWANPQRALISYSIPLAFALGVFAWNGSAASRKTALQLLLLVLCGALIGTLLHGHTLSGVNNIAGAGHARWLGYGQMLDNLSRLPAGILAQLGGVPTPDLPVVSAKGIFELLRFGAAFVLLAVIPFAVARSMARSGEAIQFLSAFTLASFAVVFTLLITTTIPDMSDPISSSRYLVPSIFLGLIILLMTPLVFARSPGALLASAAVIVMLVSSGYSVARLSNTASQNVWNRDATAKVEQQQVLDYLAAKNLVYGYATFWHAGQLTVLTEEKVRVRQILFDGGLPMPYRHLSSNRWYRPATWDGKTFLLLKVDEMKALDIDKLAMYGTAPISTHAIGKFEILEFQDNIARHIPGWDRDYQSPVNIPVTAYSNKQVGRLLEESGHAYSLIADSGTSGHLHYGPYLTATPGKYRAVFHLVAAHHPAGAVHIDVHDAASGSIRQEMTLKSAEGSYEMNFDIDKQSTLEFRVRALGNGRVVFRGVTLQRIVEDGVPSRHH